VQIGTLDAGEQVPQCVDALERGAQADVVVDDFDLQRRARGPCLW